MGMSCRKYSERVYGILLVRYLLTSSRKNLKWYEHIVKGGYGPSEMCTAPMVDLGAYEFRILNTKKYNQILFYECIHRRSIQIGKHLYFC